MKQQRDPQGYLSASELAEMGICERRLRFDALYGRRTTAQQARAKRRGLDEHAKFYQESLAIAEASRTKGKCFIATLTIGTCEDTMALRAFRDLYLRRSVAGRRIITTYYRCGPALCSLLARSPTSRWVVTAGVRALAVLARRAVAAKVGER